MLKLTVKNALYCKSDYLCVAFWFSDICAKRHLRERHLYDFWSTELRGKGTKLGEEERKQAG
jgi:hypothetical protein